MKEIMGIKIQKVKIKNFKVIKDFEKDLEGKSLFLIADNSRGKSSMMQAINIALGNTSVIPQEMTGEAVVEVTKNGEPYTFSFKTGKDGKPALSVTLPNGLKESKKGIIGGIVGALDFDIDAFVKMSETTAGKKKQVEEFKKLLPQEFINGLKEYELKIKNLYDERTEVNRKIDTLEGFIRESPLFGADLKLQPVDVTSLSEQLDKANAHNNKIKDVQGRFTEREKSIQAKIDRINAANAEIEALKSEILELERVSGTEATVQKQAEKFLAEAKVIDTTEILSQINNASEINVKASKAVDHNAKLKQLDAFKESAGDLTVQLEVTKQTISDAIKDFDSPVEGLSFDDEQLIYNNVPVDVSNLSTSEIIHLGIKMKIAANPEAGLIFIEHGESLGQQRLKEILELAKKYDLQLFIEEVKRGQDELTVEFINE